MTDKLRLTHPRQDPRRRSASDQRRQNMEIDQEMERRTWETSFKPIRRRSTPLDAARRALFTIRFPNDQVSNHSKENSHEHTTTASTSDEYATAESQPEEHDSEIRGEEEGS